MIGKKSILTILFTVIGFAGVFATAQYPNILVYNGDTIYVYLSLLPDEFYEIDTVTFESSGHKYVDVNRTLTVNLFGVNETACYYEFRPTWEITNNQLYLTGIYSGCYYRDSIKADLTSLFKEKVINGKVKADWISLYDVRGGGKELEFFIGDLPVFKKELKFEFLKGKLINVESFDNSKSRKSTYSQDEGKTLSFIYTTIAWDILPKQQMPCKVIARYSANEDGKIDEVEIMKKSDNDIFNQEAVRVIKSIPDWEVIFLRGQLYRHWFSVSILFSEEYREKYGK